MYDPLVPTFQPWPKIARLNREIIVTEKIDGSNAAIGVLDDGTVYAQSRKKLITPEADNFGFARWVDTNKDVLQVLLGPGLHFGEWWGRGIQRGYGLEGKQFSLFNTSRWEGLEHEIGINTVPVLYQGMFNEMEIRLALADLEIQGSKAAPGWMDPEGVIVFHTAANLCFKAFIKDDDVPKGSTEQPLNKEQ